MLGVLGSAAVLGLAVLALRGLLAAGGVPLGGSLADAVSRPDAMALDRLRAEGLLWALPRMRSAQAMLLAYHPLVLAAAAGGLCLLPRRFALLTAVASATALLTHAHYAAGWTVMSAYPFVYLAAGTACAWAGARVARPLGRRDPRLVPAVAVALVLVLAAVTNADLWGNAGFVRQWLGIYAPAAPY